MIEDGSPIRRKISIESFTDRGIIVRSGLLTGEEIVVEGTQYLREGSQIEIIEIVEK